MPSGLPLRTTNTTVDVNGTLASGRRCCQLAAMRPDFDWIASMSYDIASVTRSASRPSITARACLPEPPCDWLTVSVCPVLLCQCLAKAVLTSWYSSRVGSYETLSSFRPAGAPPPRLHCAANSSRLASPARVTISSSWARCCRRRWCPGPAADLGHALADVGQRGPVEDLRDRVADLLHDHARAAGLLAHALLAARRRRAR